MTPYRPSGKIDPASTLMLLAATLAVGAAVGGVANVIGQFFRLIVLFPLGMGFAVGLIGAQIVGWRRVQAPIVAGLIGLLAAMTAWGTDYLIDYGRQRSMLTAEVNETLDAIAAESGEQVPRDRVGAAVDDILVGWGQGEDSDMGQVFATLIGEPIEMEDGSVYTPGEPATAMQALAGYTRSRLDAGTTIGKVGRDGSNVGPIGTAILWGVELLLAGGVGAYLLYGRAKEPLCQQCGGWYASGTGIHPVGPLEAKIDLIEAMERGDTSRVGSFVPAGGFTLPLVGLRFRGCPNCENAQVFTEVVGVHAGKKEDQEKILRSGMVPPGVARDAVQALERAAQTQQG